MKNETALGIYHNPLQLTHSPMSVTTAVLDRFPCLRSTSSPGVTGAFALPFTARFNLSPGRGRY